MYVLLKLLHIAFLLFWLAGALYLPRLFQQTVKADAEGVQALIQMQRRVYFEIMTPAAIIAVILGTALIFFGYEGGWLPVKLSLILLLTLFHIYCGREVLQFEKGRLPHGARYFFLLNLAPVPVLMAIIALAVAKPF